MGAWDNFVQWVHGAERALGLRAPSAEGAAGEAAPALSDDDSIVGPAFPWLAGWTADDRRALREVQIAVGLDPAVGGLLAVIDHESGGRADALNSLPAAGLIQVTTAAKLPGFDTPERVREIATWSPARQLRGPVLDFYRRAFPHGAPAGEAGQGGVVLLRRNFLPALAGESTSYVLAVNAGATGPGGESPTDVLPGGLTRGAIYRSNYGFDVGAKLDRASGTISGGRGFFAWEDADRQAQASVARGRSRGSMTVSGRVLPADPAMGGLGQDAADWFIHAEHVLEEMLGLRAPAASAVAPAADPSDPRSPALLQLLRQVDAAYPGRSKASDGIMGDAAHVAAGKSGHNAGDAIDITRDLARGPDLAALAAAALADERVDYAILDGHIANPKIDSGVWRTYPGPNPHRTHLHVSVLHDKRGDARPWRIPVVNWNEALPDPPMAGASVSPAAPAIDPPTWVQVDVPGAGYRIWTNAEPLARGGVPLPMSFDQEIQACRALNALPVTAVVEDARWLADPAPRVVPAVSSPDGAHFNDAAQNATFAAQYGPLGTTLRAGGSKAMLVEADRRRISGKGPDGQDAAALKPSGPKSMVFYGWRKAQGAPSFSTRVQHGGLSDHNRQWIEYDSFAYVMRRDATRNGAPVDLLADLAAGCPLGGPLPGWLVSELSGGEPPPAAKPDPGPPFLADLFDDLPASGAGLGKAGA